MFKENFKAAFGLVTGLAAGIWVVSAVSNLIDGAKKPCNEEKPAEKSKAEEWADTIE